MAGKARQITKTQLRIGVIVMIVLFIGLFYYASIEDRLMVHEGNGFFFGSPLIQERTLSYKTEFCANKLSLLAHEVHFFEMDIKEETELIEEDLLTVEEEAVVIEIEQAELEKLREKFYKYKDMCDAFDETPTKELCDQFLGEANHSLILAQENAKAAESKGILERIGLSSRELRKAERIYQGLQDVCVDVANTNF